MSCSSKTSPDAPTESHPDSLPTTPSSGSARNSRFPPLQTVPPPDPAPLPVARSPAQPSYASDRNRIQILSPPRRLLVLRVTHDSHRSKLSHRQILHRSRLLAHQHNLRTLQTGGDAAPPLSHPMLALTSESHTSLPHPPETAKSPHRSTRTLSTSPPPAPPLHEILAILSAGESPRSPPDSSLPSLR